MSGTADQDKPSQAEGADPDRPGEGEAPPEQGHPSQAEGEDPDRPNDGEDTDPQE